MTDVWSGDIIIPDGEPIKDVGFSTIAGNNTDAIPARSLRFLSTVNTAKIPLYLAIGPSHDVWTTNEASEAWFESMLLSEPATSTGTTGNGGEWWTLARAQSPVGILVQVDSQLDEAPKPRVTEVLLYGTIAVTGVVEGLLPELRVHAIPLSSDLLHQNESSATLPPPTANTADEPVDIDAQYLPQSYRADAIPTSPKRKRDLFEEATLAKRRAKGKGGEGIAAAAARVTNPQHPYIHRKSVSIELKAPPVQDSRPPSAHVSLPRPASRQLYRSSSISSDGRPLSRKETTEAHGKRSHLSRVNTVTPQLDELTTESRNKEALTKVVLAAMRMHGLQQRKRAKSRRASMAYDTEEAQPLTDDMAAEDAVNDEEFKVIYHQTYKGAVLALRNHMADIPLHTQPDRMRDLVEQFLALFLNDPLAPSAPSRESTNPVSTPGFKQYGIFGSAHHASPFDLPSGMRRPPIARAQTDGQVYTGSPVSKSKSNDRTPAAV